MGLLDGLLGTSMDDPRTMGLLALASGLVKGDFGGGLLGYGQAYQGAQDQAMKRKLTQAQLDNYESEVAQRKMALERQQQLMSMLPKVLGAPAPAQQGQLGSGTFGIMPTARGVPDMPQGGSGLQNARIEDIATLQALGGPDLLNAYKLAKEGFERKPGSFYENLQGQRSYVGDPTKGITYENGRVGVMPGFTDAQSAITLASEGPKAVLQSLGQVNLRPMANGQQAPVPAINENPAMQGLAERYLGIRPMGGAQPAQPPAMPRPMAQPASVRPDPSVTAGTFQGDPAAISAAIEQIKDPQERANARQSFEMQMRATGGNLGYGKTTAQETQDAANLEYAKKTATDVADQRKSIVSAGFSAPTNIAKLNQLGQLLSGVDGGKYTPFGTEVASALNSFGIKVDKNLPNKQAAAALGNEIALQLRNPAGGAGMPGALSDKDREFLQSMTPNMAQSLEGRTKLIQSRIALEQRNQQVAQFARNYENKYGRLDNGFFDQLAAWSNANPLFGAK